MRPRLPYFFLGRGHPGSARVAEIRASLGDLPDSVSPIPDEHLEIRPLNSAGGVKLTGSKCVDCWVIRDRRHSTKVKLQVHAVRPVSNVVLFVNRPVSRLRIHLAGSNARFWMGSGRTFNGRVNIGQDSVISVGDETTAMSVKVVAERSHVRIGQDCMIAGSVTINSAQHHGVIDLKAPELKVNPLKEGIDLDDHIWVGLHSNIVGNLHLASGSIVGASAVVTNSFPANSIIAGNPAEIRGRNVTWSRSAVHIDGASQRYIASIPDIPDIGATQHISKHEDFSAQSARHQK